MNKTRRIALHVFVDWLAATISWLGLFFFRKNYIEASKHGYEIPINHDDNLLLGLLFVPVFWITLYAVSGYYNYIFRRSRLNELQHTFNASVIGVLFLFFTLILDDSISDYRDYYLSVATLFGFHFSATLLFRLAVVTKTIHNIKNRIWGYNTLIVGCGERALNLYQELNSAKKSEGFFIKGFVKIQDDCTLKEVGARILGDWTDLPALIKEQQVEDIILCTETGENEQITTIIDCVQNENIHLKIMPDQYSLVLGMVKMNNILGTMLVEVDFEVMPTWQKVLKRMIDILVSGIALLLLSPVFILLILLVRLDSKGPIFFTQPRIGLKGKLFNIIKFRSMRVDAEKTGPQLSHDEDNRRTRIGVFLRQSRLDEIPQFVNVLMGQMSLVGPRPEREFFKDQIIIKAPIYQRLHRIKPGITSWGQIKYGYASNVEEMIDRMKYDILYLENMSLGLDFKIMLYTVLIMVQGRGK
ncbi:MAG: sugar transferase [Bacteroidetes bacterium]|nr:sugar transferase [Bacteroidota bacterium]